MIRLETETDIERLRQVALLQRAELDRLYQRLAQLTELTQGEQPRKTGWVRAFRRQRCQRIGPMGVSARPSAVHSSL